MYSHSVVKNQPRQIVAEMITSLAAGNEKAEIILRTIQEICGDRPLEALKILDIFGEDIPTWFEFMRDDADSFTSLANEIMSRESDHLRHNITLELERFWQEDDNKLQREVLEYARRAHGNS